MRDSRGHGSRIPLLRSAYGAPMGAFSADRLRSGQARDSWGPGSQERYARILRIHLLPGGLASLGVQGTRRKPS